MSRTIRNVCNGSCHEQNYELTINLYMLLRIRENRYEKNIILFFLKQVFWCVISSHLKVFKINLKISFMHNNTLIFSVDSL